MKGVRITIQRRKGAEDISIPAYATDGSSGMDLYADIDGELTLQPGQISSVSVGCYMSIPKGYEAQIRPRSGLALRHGIGLVNSPGTVDSDYRGLVKVIIVNMGREPYTLHRGDRIAQMVIQEVVRAEISLSSELDTTVRAEGGFGHTGR